jgi:GTP cyclohydrolase I
VAAAARSGTGPVGGTRRSVPADAGRSAADPLEQHVTALLRGIGEDPSREGLLKTPGRVVRALRELTRGYDQDVQTVLNEALFTESYNEMVIVKDIELYSLCEHHLLPWFGKAHVAYLPNGKILGLSKIARVVDVFARRLQVQERLTTQIAETLMEALQPKGVGVVVEARHLCMTMRGVEKQHSVAMTSAMLGLFRSNPPTRAEFLNLIRPAPQAP